MGSKRPRPKSRRSRGRTMRKALELKRLGLPYKKEARNNASSSLASTNQKNVDIEVIEIKTESPLDIEETRITSTIANDQEQSLPQQRHIDCRPNIHKQQGKKAHAINEGSFDDFGRFIASLLREKPEEEATKLEKEIVHMIMK